MEAATLSGGRTLTQRKPDKGRRSAIVPTQLQSNLHTRRDPHFSLYSFHREISLSSVISRFNALPLHPPHYEVLINCTGVKQNGLTFLVNSISIELSTSNQGRRPYSFTPPDLWFTLHQAGAYCASADKDLTRGPHYNGWQSYCDSASTTTVKS